jgi:hypothetical protein
MSNAICRMCRLVEINTGRSCFSTMLYRSQSYGFSGRGTNVPLNVPMSVLLQNSYTIYSFAGSSRRSFAASNAGLNL